MQLVITRSVDYYYWCLFTVFLYYVMKAIIFDMDGVLVDAMPFHYQAMKSAVKEITSIDLDKFEIS